MVEAKTAGANAEAHLGGHSIPANTLAKQAQHHLQLEEEVRLPMTLDSLQVDREVDHLGNLSQVVPIVHCGN